MEKINDYAFELYHALLDNSIPSKKDRSLSRMLRYVISGYVFKRNYYIEKLNEYNRFTPTTKSYPNTKVAIYTVNTGNYDVVKNPIYMDSSIDYYIFTDAEPPKNSIWKKKSFTEKEDLSPLELSRFVKMFPDLFFSDYDYTIYIDNNVRITCDIKPLVYSLIESGKCIAMHSHQSRDSVYEEAKVVYAQGRAKKKDIKEQMIAYRKEGFPAHFGMFENNIIIRKTNDEQLNKVMKTWWYEFEKYTKRDQLSFTYSLWKNGLTTDYVMSLGNNSRKNPFFVISQHR